MTLQKESPYKKCVKCNRDFERTAMVNVTTGENSDVCVWCQP